MNVGASHRRGGDRPPAAKLEAMTAQDPTSAGARPSAPVLEHEAATTRHDAADDVFTPELHVYEPHRIGLPPIGPYLQGVWRRRQFAYELSRTSLRAQHFSTAFGQLWLILNPVLLAAVYFLLVDILRHGRHGPGFFAHLMAGVFAFTFFSGSVIQGARSVVKSGRLVLNTAFPRTLLPLSAVLTCFYRFLPTVGVYAIFHVASGLPVGPQLLWIIPIFGMLVMFAAGIAMLVAAAQVYFRDVQQFLPYVMRIWMYSTPILYFYFEVPRHLRYFIDANPLTPIFASWSRVLNQGLAPSPKFMLWGLGWAVAALVIGAVFFISREREFAVRL
jgi:ABC-type polysaccharide/polyol phosphate export permease